MQKNRQKMIQLKSNSYFSNLKMRLTTTTKVKGGLDGYDREGEVFSSQKSKVV